MNKIFNNKLIWLFLLILSITLQYNSSIIFDGLPFEKNIETIIISTMFPLFIFFYRNFSIKLIFKIFIIFVILIKLTNFLSPNYGINHNQYLSEEKNNNFISSYNSIWNKDKTSIQKYSWLDFKNFPIEWINYSDQSIYPDIFVNMKIEDINIYHDIDFYLVTNKKILFKIETNETSIANLKFLNISSNKKINHYSVNDTIELDKGIYFFEGNINFVGKDLKFIPYIFYEDNKFMALENQYIFSDIKSLLNINLINTFFYIGYFLDILILIIIVSLTLNIFKIQINKKYLLLFLLSIFFILICLFINMYLNTFLQIFNYYDYLGVWPLPITYFIILITFLFLHYFNPKIITNLTIKNYIIITLPTYLIFWILFFKDDLQSFSLWTRGDDWNGFQYFARRIVIENEWLRGGEGVFYFRPFLRYVIGLFHILFGDSSFAFKFIDVWSVFLSSLIIIKLLKFKNVSNIITFVSGILIIIIFTGENFRYLIGRGLSEYFGMLCVMIIVYCLYSRKIKVSFKLIVFIIAISIIPYTREEKIFVALALIFMSKNYYDIMKQSNNFFYSLYKFFITEYKLIITYSLFLLFMFPLLFEYRNYIVGGYFGLTSHEFVNKSIFQGGFDSYYKMLTTEVYPNIPKLTSVILLPAILISLINIFYRKQFITTDIRFSIILLSLFLPTILHEIHGYNPRYVIYTLPLSVFIVSLFISKYKIIRRNEILQ